MDDAAQPLKPAAGPDDLRDDDDVLIRGKVRKVGEVSALVRFESGYELMQGEIRCTKLGVFHSTPPPPTACPR